MIDYGNLQVHEDSKEEYVRLEEPSGEKCVCGKEMSTGDFECFGLCLECVQKAFREAQEAEQE